jgi:hypothetical protein
VDACPKLHVRVSLVPPIPPFSGNELASVACSPENKVSLHGGGIGDFMVGANGGGDRMGS